RPVRARVQQHDRQRPLVRQLHLRLPAAVGRPAERRGVQRQMITTRFGQRLAQGVTIAIVLGLVVAGGLWWTLKDAGTKQVTAYFPSAIGLYEGNSVRVLGVDMGEVTKVEP